MSPLNGLLSPLNAWSGVAATASKHLQRDPPAATRHGCCCGWSCCWGCCGRAAVRLRPAFRWRNASVSSRNIVQPPAAACQAQHHNLGPGACAMQSSQQPLAHREVDCHVLVVWVLEIALLDLPKLHVNLALVAGHPHRLGVPLGAGGGCLDEQHARRTARDAVIPGVDDALAAIDRKRDVVGLARDMGPRRQQSWLQRCSVRRKKRSQEAAELVAALQRASAAAAWQTARSPATASRCRWWALPRSTGRGTACTCAPACPAAGVRRCNAACAWARQPCRVQCRVHRRRHCGGMAVSCSGKPAPALTSIANTTSLSMVRLPLKNLARSMPAPGAACTQGNAGQS